MGLGCLGDDPEPGKTPWGGPGVPYTSAGKGETTTLSGGGMELGCLGDDPEPGKTPWGGPGVPYTFAGKGEATTLSGGGVA